MRGKYIVIEGIDGSGKDTQAEKLARFLCRKGKKVLVTQEPSHGPIGVFIRELLHSSMKLEISQEELQTFFVLDRAWHWKNVVEPALQKGQIVISDRNWLSAFVYGAAGGLLPEKIRSLHKKFSVPLVKPDILMVIRITPGTQRKRLRKRKASPVIFETIRFEEKAVRLYDKFGERFGAEFIDGNGSSENVFSLIHTIVDTD